MNGEILDINTLNKINSTEKENIRLKREKNFLEIQLKVFNNKYDKMEQENRKLQKRNKILDTVEMYLKARKNKLEETNDRKYDLAVLELSKLINALEEENKKIEGIEDEEEFTW